MTELVRAVPDIHDKLFIFIVGDEDAVKGGGKTTLAGSLSCLRMIPPQSDIDIAECENMIEDLRENGWDNLYLPDHVDHTVYVVEDTFTTNHMGYEPVTSMKLKFDNLRLYDGTENVSHILPKATVTIPEIQKHLDCRNSIKEGAVDEYVLRLLELQRKFKLRFIADSQFYYSTEKRLREASDLVIEVINQFHKYDGDGMRNKTIWNLRIFNGSGQYERYKKGEKKLGKLVQHTHFGDIFECVNSFTGSERFLDGMYTKNFDTEISVPPGHRKEDILRYCQENPIKKVRDSKKAKEERSV